jgi:hypothetical protein
MKSWQKKLGVEQPLAVKDLKPKEVRFDDLDRKPDQWQPAWIIEKYFRDRPSGRRTLAASAGRRGAPSPRHGPTVGIELTTKNALALGARHSFLVMLDHGYYPINVLNTLKVLPEVCRVFSRRPAREACSKPRPSEVDLQSQRISNWIS